MRTRIKMYELDRDISYDRQYHAGEQLPATHPLIVRLTALKLDYCVLINGIGNNDEEE